jgi:hypothetical protein
VARDGSGRFRDARRILLLLDPYGTGRLTPFRSATVREQGPRTANAHRAADSRFDGVILGNSHIQLVEPAALRAALGTPFVSLIVPATGPREQFAILEYRLSRHSRPPDALVWGIDDRWCAAEDHPALTHPFPFWLYDPNDAAYAAGLVRWSALEELPPRLLALLGLSRRPAARPDGFWDYEAYREWRADVVGPRLAKREPPFLVNRTGRYPQIERLGRTLAALPASVRVVLVRPPVHASALPQPDTDEARSEAGCRAALEEAARARARTAMLDRRVDAPDTRDPANFFDPTHYRRPVARALGARHRGRARAHAAFVAGAPEGAHDAARRPGGGRPHRSQLSPSGRSLIGRAQIRPVAGSSRRGLMTQSSIDERYKPAEDEPFMNERQREYFRRKLSAWKGEILQEAQGRCPRSRPRTRTIPTSPTALPPRRTGRSSSGRATASAS